MKKKSLLFLLVFNLNFAQKTQQYNEEKGSVKATLKTANWLIGNWKNTTPNNQMEENWSAPMGNTQMFSFKMVKNNQVVFYEVGHIIEVGKTIELVIKHFDENLKPIEMQENFKYIKSERNKLLFDGITYERVGNNILNVYVYMEDEKKEVKFEFKK